MLDVVTGTRKPNIEFLKDHFFHEGRLTEEQAMWILEETTKLMSKEPNLLRVKGPVTGTHMPLTATPTRLTSFSLFPFSRWRHSRTIREPTSRFIGTFTYTYS